VAGASRTKLSGKTVMRKNAITSDLDRMQLVEFFKCGEPMRHW
jgi:hypothetical protein